MSNKFGFFHNKSAGLVCEGPFFVVDTFYYVFLTLAGPIITKENKHPTAMTLLGRMIEPEEGTCSLFLSVSFHRRCSMRRRKKKKKKKKKK